MSEATYGGRCPECDGLAGACPCPHPIALTQPTIDVIVPSGQEITPGAWILGQQAKLRAAEADANRLSEALGWTECWWLQEARLMAEVEEMADVGAVFDAKMIELSQHRYGTPINVVQDAAREALRLHKELRAED